MSRSQTQLDQFLLDAWCGKWWETVFHWKTMLFSLENPWCGTFGSPMFFSAFFIGELWLGASSPARVWRFLGHPQDRISQWLGRFHRFQPPLRLRWIVSSSHETTCLPSLGRYRFAVDSECMYTSKFLENLKGPMQLDTLLSSKFSKKDV